MTSAAAPRGPAEEGAATPARGRLLGPFLLLFLVAFSALVRVDVAFSDPGFDVAAPEGMLKSDPALLYYFTERILEAGGLPPDDFRADPRVEHPDVVDVPARFTVGQEFLAAWAYRAFGGDAPLHVFCVRLFAVTASLVLVGVYGVVLACTRSRAWALGAAALAAVLPASYRTIGFVLIREDVSLPLFALHLAFAAAAYRRSRSGSASGPRSAIGAALLSGVALAGALATWHAATFVALLEAAAAVVLFLLRGANPLRGRAGLAVLVPVIVAAVAVPALRAKGLLVSPAMALALGLAWAGRSGGAASAAPGTSVLRRLAPVLGVAVAVAGAGLLLAFLRGGGGAADLRHVYDVMAAKVVHLGRLPDDPNELSFDARLLWQGPFETLPLSWAWTFVGWGVVAVGIGLGARLASRARLEDDELALSLFGAISLVVAWLFLRLVVLPAILLPALAAVTLSRATLGRRHAFAPIALGALVLIQGRVFTRYASTYRISWYADTAQTEAIAELVAWIDANLPPDEPVVGDFVNSTAILAHTRRPIALQPKYEADESRRRAEAFLKTFFHGTPADLAALVGGRFEASWVLVDTLVLGRWSPYTAGLPAGRAPGSETAAAWMLNREPAVHRNVPGFELVHTSSPPGAQLRLYRITAPPTEPSVDDGG